MRCVIAWMAALAMMMGAPARAQDAALPVRLETLAGQGNAEAAYHLGMIYHLGLEGVARDPRRAFDYFRRAAEGGDPLGAYKVGCFYAGQGEGVVTADPERALRYKLVAAEAGYALAQIDVARIYADRGDRPRAVQWYEAAARQGDWTALFMALIQIMPDGPHPDRPRAWLYFAVINRTLAGIPMQDRPEAEARQMRAALAEMRRSTETGMSAADRAEGARLLAEWRVERSAVTLRADQGLDAARRLAGIAVAG